MFSPRAICSDLAPSLFSQKWTGSPTLGARFRDNVLGHPKSFTRRDFSQLQAQYDDVLNTLRTTQTSFSEPSSPSCDEHPTPTPAPPRRRSGAEEDQLFTPLPPPQQAQRQHYWNEYDDGSEAGGEDGYAIYINPDDYSGGFPGLQSLQTALATPLEKLRVWFGRPPNPERQPLLPTTNGDGTAAAAAIGGPPLLVGYSTTIPAAAATATTETDEDCSSSDELFPAMGYRAHYAATFPSVGEQRMTRYRERVLFAGTLGCFAASFLLLGIAALLIVTGRHKLRAEVDAGATLGAVASLCCACVALGMTMYRRDPLSAMHRTAVGVTFLTSCLLNGMVLVLVVGSATTV